jgi:hypothetical protein
MNGNRFKLDVELVPKEILEFLEDGTASVV